jgi:predicted nuclease of predicted toxin-antitoxin system
MDENVDGRIVRELRRRGVDVVTVQSDGRSGTADTLVLDRATELGRLLFSQDTDLLAEATRRQRADIDFARLVYGRVAVDLIGRYAGDLELISFCADPIEYCNRVEYLPL